MFTQTDLIHLTVSNCLWTALHYKQQFSSTGKNRNKKKVEILEQLFFLVDKYFTVIIGSVGLAEIYRQVGRFERK